MIKKLPELLLRMLETKQINEVFTFEFQRESRFIIETPKRVKFKINKT